jgi:hypothetical protein
MFDSSYHPLTSSLIIPRLHSRLGKNSHERNVPSVLENRGLTDPAEIEQALRFGEYIKNGTPMIKSNPFFDVFFFSFVVH